MTRYRPRPIATGHRSPSRTATRRRRTRLHAPLLSLQPPHACPLYTLADLPNTSSGRRFGEVRKFDPGLEAGVKWAIDAGKRAGRGSMKANLLSDDEALVLAAYRFAKEDWPLGINETPETVSGLVAHFQVQLERSSMPLLEEVEATQAEEPIAPELETKIESFKTKLRLKSWVMATKRGASMYAKRGKEKV